MLLPKYGNGKGRCRAKRLLDGFQQALRADGSA